MTQRVPVGRCHTFPCGTHIFRFRNRNIGLLTETRTISRPPRWCCSRCGLPESAASCHRRSEPDGTSVGHRRVYYTLYDDGKTNSQAYRNSKANRFTREGIEINTLSSPFSTNSADATMNLWVDQNYSSGTCDIQFADHRQGSGYGPTARVRLRGDGECGRWHQGHRCLEWRATRRPRTECK